MKAARWYAKKDIRVEDIAVPAAPKAGEVQIEVAWCGICGSDLHEYIAGPIFIPVEPHPLTGAKAPLTLGHEFSGKVVAIGAGVNNVKVGDLVAPDACQHCGECLPCRMGNYNVCEKLAFTGLANEGAFAKYVNVPAQLCYVLPPDFNLEIASLIEPLATGFKAVRMAGSIMGKMVVVFGGGTIGLGTMMCAKAAGASKVVVIEMAAARKALAKQCGADVILDPKECDVVAEVKRLSPEGTGADVSFECIGNKFTGPQAIDVIHNCGKAIIVGIFEEPSSFNFFSLSATDKCVQGTLAYTIDDFAGVANLLASGQLKAEPMITGRIKLDDIVNGGFEELIANKAKHIKIIVSPT